MNKTDMKQRIESFQDKEFGKGAEISQIVDAENELGVKFPPSYVQFLENFGWGRFSNESIYGLGLDTPLHLNLVRNAIAERKQMYPPLPKKLIPIMNDGAGNHFCLATSEEENIEVPVVFWDHELSVDQIPEPVARSFDQWLVEMLNGLDEST